MTEPPKGVQEVREWRRQLAEEWEGKSLEEIQHLLNERGRKFRESMEGQPSLSIPSVEIPADDGQPPR